MAKSEQETAWTPKPDDSPQQKRDAEAGDAIAQYNLGCCYFRGEGVDVDQVEAVKWFREAAERGLPQAQFNLGMCYTKGRGVAKSDVEACRWLNHAAQQGIVEAERILKQWWGD